MTTPNTVYVCIKQFNARLGDELSLKVGDKIEVLADDSEYNDGWYMGREVSRGQVGLFPKSFTKVFVQSDAPGLLRSRSRRVLTNSSNVSSSSTNANTSAANTSAANTSAAGKVDVHSTLDEINKVLQDFHVTTGSPADTSMASSGHQRNPSNSLLLTQDLNPLKAPEWTPKQVSSYFAIVLGFDMEIAGKFARHKITGKILLQLNLELLKELEIESFGTRFELNREIDNLRKISGRVDSHRNAHLSKQMGEEATELETSSKASPPFNNSDEDVHTNATSAQSSATKDYRKHSEPFLLPSANFKSSDPNADVSRSYSTAGKSVYSHNRTKSQSMENLRQRVSRDGNKSPKMESPAVGSFMSPRKAPQPPSTSPLNTGFRFGGSPMAAQIPFNPHSPYMTRTAAASTTNVALRPASSIYESTVISHSRVPSSNRDYHRRHSSVFLFMSENNEDLPKGDKGLRPFKSPVTPKKEGEKPKPSLLLDTDTSNMKDVVDIDDANFSPKKSLSTLGPRGDEKDSLVRKLKSLRSVSTQNFRNLTGLKKLKTSAFTEGIRDINPDDAIKTSNYSGWMSKKSGGTLGWRSRYFTLHGTRLSYFTSLRDKREKGLIDITAHKVIPVSTENEINPNDKYVAIYASLTGFGRYCFKLVPPAPGFKKGLMFTQPKTHFFAVETQEEMRGWMKALMTATIDIDDSVPVVSSCNTPTVTLAKAQELLAKAREETKLKDESLKARGFGILPEESPTLYNESATSEESSPIVRSLDETTISSGNNPLKLTIDTLGKATKAPGTPRVGLNTSGFASPYLLASGLLSPKQNTPPAFTTAASEGTTPQPVTNLEYFSTNLENLSSDARSSQVDIDDRPKSPASSHEISASRMIDGMKKKLGGEKMMAYTSDGSFVIKTKKNNK